MSLLNGGEWLASHPSTHWTGGWAGPRAGLDVVGREKFPAPAGNQTLVVLLMA